PSIDSPAERPGPPGFEWLRDEDYRGPLLLRLDLDPEVRVPRDLERAAPLFPRGWGGRAGGGLLPRLISVAAGPTGLVFALDPAGRVYVAESALHRIVRLPLPPP